MNVYEKNRIRYMKDISKVWGRIDKTLDELFVLYGERRDLENYFIVSDFIGNSIREKENYLVASLIDLQVFEGGLNNSHERYLQSL